jgi:bifunctional NMN adenylyltransferase/nudix hydrolase
MAISNGAGSPADFDLAVFIGRFQIFHNGHLAVLNEALTRAERVVVLVGSVDLPRSHRNPFSFDERRQMILESLHAQERERVAVLPLPDHPYNDGQWVAAVQAAVAEIIRDGTISDSPSETTRIALIGHSKDSTSFYLKLFPQWGAIDVPNHLGLSSTSMRKSYFSNVGPLWIKNCDGHRPGDLARDAYVPSAVRSFLLQFMEKPEYADILNEYEYISNYRVRWSSAPYPPVFVTVDACVVQSGHILLVRRKERPGKGLWALPGGFINQLERTEDAMLRELREETRIRVPAPVLKGSIVASRVFDDPNRSARGRTITHAYLMNLRPDTKLPEVRGGDDAEKAQWWPLAAVTSDMMFEDHHAIIQNLTAML